MHHHRPFFRLPARIASLVPGGLSLLRRRAAATVALVALACAPRSQPVAPKVTPSSTLRVAPTGETRPAPFSIAHVSPEGPTTGDPSIFVVLSRPARSLAPDQPLPEGLSVRPSAPGHWEWVGAYALTFVPDGGRLPAATDFEVTVPAGLRSLEGESLGEGRTFRFQSPRPLVTSMWPQTWDRSVEPDAAIVLQLSQPSEPNDLAAAIHVSSKDGEIPVTVSRGKTDTEVRVVAQEGWPLNREITTEVRPGWRAKEGPLLAVQSFEGSFQTYGPLTASVECSRNQHGRCEPEGGLFLRLSNPVSARALARAIRADGKALHVDQQWEPEARTEAINLGVRLAPRDKFTVSVDPIRDIYGQALSWVKNRQVEVADYQPVVRVGFSGDAFLPEQTELSIHARNSGYELSSAAVTPEALATFSKLDWPKRYAALTQLPKVRTQRVPTGKLNEWQRTTLRLDDLTQSGLFLVGVRYHVNDAELTEVRWGQRTDLGLTVKSGRDRARAWITRLSTGAPVPGAQVLVLGATGTGTTDANGLVTLPEGILVSHPDGRRESEWLEARLDNEVGYRNTDESIGAWRLPVSTNFWDNDEDLALLFPERDLFRPGERAWVKGYLRRPVTTGTAGIRNERLSLELVSPTDEVVQTRPVKTNDYGAIAERLTVPRSAQLGYWTLRLRRGEEALATTMIQVAEYRPAAFEVAVRSPEQSVLAGAPVTWNITGTYLTGGAMGGAKLESSLRREQASFSPPGHEGRVTDDSVWQNYEVYRPYSVYLESHEDELAADGQFKRETSSKLDHQSGPERLEFEATITDLSAQALSSRTSVLVHPAAYYPAMEPLESTLLDAPGSVSPKVLAVTPAGQVTVGRPLSLTLYRVRWTHVKQPGSPGASATTQEPVRDVIERCSVTSGTEARSCSLKVTEPGTYIIRTTVTDEAGRSVSSSLDFYALGSGSNSAWRDEDERGLVELTADRKAYQVGQRARILVKSPFEQARAWVTVERNGVLEGHVERLTGPSPSIVVPITADMQPNAFVGVHLIEDRAALGKKAHGISDSYRFGYAELRLDPEARRLSVNIKSNKEAYRPREEVQLSLAVTDRLGRGHRSEIALFVIDEGVLSLSGYEMPDPLSTFLQPRPLRVETMESRESMARVFGFEPNQDENKGDPGGDGDGDRANMLTAAYFNPAVVTDAGGRAKVKFPLPDNIGRFRVMAVAVSEDDYFGKGRGSLTVNQALMVRPALPRFLRAGDSFETAVAVQTLDFAGGDVRVAAALQGARLLSAPEQTLALGRNDARLVRFFAEAPLVGEATFRLAASSATEKDAVRFVLPVQTPAQLETVALYGKTEAAEGHSLGALDDVRQDMGELNVTLSSSALVGLEGGFEQLWDYPYLCSEQLASRALPLIMLRDFAALYGIAAPKDADRRIEDAVGQLVRRQRGDGGFGMWPESPESSPWVTAYALWVLFEAKERGLSLQQSTFDQGLRYLRDVAAKRNPENLTEAVFATLVMGRLKAPDPQSVAALAEQIDQMSVEAQILLAWAASRAGKEAGLGELERALVQRVEGSITLRGNAAEITTPHGTGDLSIMSSGTRRHAFALQALLAAQPDHPLAAPLVRTLLDARKGQGWRSTQEAAFALLALDAYRRAQERDEPDLEGLVFLGARLLGSKRFLGRSTKAEEFTVEMKELVQGGDLIFQQKGRGTLFYEARLRYARNALPKEPLESGFSVQKRMLPIGGSARSDLATAVPDVQKVQRGELVEVEVIVVTPTRRRFVVIDDPLPAGLEALDPSLTVAQGSLSARSASGGGYTSAWHRSELRDDRVLYFIDDMPPGVYRYSYLARATTAGRFVTPPTRAMEMYQPEVYGRTAARTVTVEHPQAKPHPGQASGLTPATIAKPRTAPPQALR